MPLVKASVWSLLEARPVRAMMRAGEEEEGLVSRSSSLWLVLLGLFFLLLWLRASSMSRMARVASKPFIIGMLISVDCQMLLVLAAGSRCGGRTRLKPAVVAAGRTYP